MIYALVGILVFTLFLLFVEFNDLRSTVEYIRKEEEYSTKRYMKLEKDILRVMGITEEYKDIAQELADHLIGYQLDHLEELINER